MKLGSLIAVSLSLALCGTASADDFYYRSKGGTSIAPEPAPTASISAGAPAYRTATPVSGGLTSSLLDPNWEIEQIPAAPSFGMSPSGESFTGIAPPVSQTTTFSLSATATRKSKSATTAPISVTVHPLLTATGGPTGQLTSKASQAFPAQTNFVINGMVGSAGYGLLRNDADFSIGSLCAGLDFSASTGKIGGTSTATGSCNVSNLKIRVTDPFDGMHIDGATFSILVNPTTSNVLAWGRGQYGAIGDNSTSTRLSPVGVYGETTYTSVAAGQFHACGLLTNGTVECWGNSTKGQLGSGWGTGIRNRPVSVPGITGAKAIAAGDEFNCVIKSDNTVACWGANNFGQLGNSSTVQSSAPVNVTGLTGVSDISLGYGHGCAVSSGSVKCWGYNEYGQLARGGGNLSFPVDVGISGATQVSTSDISTCALASGGVRCWGYGAYGLGNGTNTNIHYSPITPNGLGSGVSALASSGGSNSGHHCAIKGGAALCWGRNDYGQLGEASTTYRNVPYQVSGLTSGVTKISKGGFHTCAIVSGSLSCWGYNNNGQLGLGHTSTRFTPNTVAMPAGRTVANVALGYDTSYAW
jgi:alpha-tubulin suppressor-like RCC1 family protein